MECGNERVIQDCMGRMDRTAKCDKMGRNEMNDDPYGKLQSSKKL